MSVFDTSTDTGAAAERRMQTDLVGWLATVARNGTPQTSPVAFLWDGETVTMWSEPGAVKVTNLVENHRCSFNLNSDEHGLGVVTLEGTVDLPPDGPGWNEVPAFVEKYAAVFTGVWNLDMDETAGEFSQQIVFTPRRARVW